MLQQEGLNGDVIYAGSCFCGKETIEIEQNIYVVSSFSALPTAYTILN
jgi:hypothetical protein